MKRTPKRSPGLWLALVILLLAQVSWAGAQGGSGVLPSPVSGLAAPEQPDALLWSQPPSATNTNPYANQDFEASLDDFDVFLADDFSTDRAWYIDTIFVPGGTFHSGCNVGCADAFTWQIYADAGGVPDGDPRGGGNPPLWSMTLAPADPQVSISFGSGGWLSDITLNLSAPLSLTPGTWWLVFYPSLDLGGCGCQYGRHVADTANGYVAQMINPGGALNYPTTWTSIQDPTTLGLVEQDLAFRLEGGGLLLLGDRVWFDTDQNGIQDPGEPGVEDIRVDLYGNGSCTGTPAASETTTASGLYTFQVSPGTYCLQFADLPADWFISPSGRGGDDTLDSDADPSTGQITNLDVTADDLDRDMGLYAKGAVGGRVWCDADYDGQYAPGEGVAGVPVRLHVDADCNGVAEELLAAEMTGGTGEYLHGNLAVGLVGDPVCYVAQVNPVDMGACNEPLVSAKHDAALDTVNSDDLEGNLGFFRWLILGDRVWYDTNQDGIQDPAEPGVPAVSVALHDNATCSGIPIISDTTDAAGLYRLELVPGTYCLQFYDVPAGWVISPQHQGDDRSRDSDADPTQGQIQAIVVSSDDLDKDMGLYAGGSVGDTVWCDGDYNGQYDPGEGVAGVPVSLYADADCNAVAEGLLATEVTANEGQYLHAGLAVGPAGEPLCYVAEVMASDMGACNHPLAATEHHAALDIGHPDDLEADFGFAKLLVLGDRVWYDTDQDGLQGPGEPGVPDIAVDLYDNDACLGVPAGSTTTDGEGRYYFGDLLGGAYCLQFFGIPAGWSISPPNQGDDWLDSDADPATGQIPDIVLLSDDVDKDMGLYTDGSIGGIVWCDSDRSGSSGPGEGLNGALVRLYGDSSCPGMDGGLLASLSTVGDGSFVFLDLYVGPADEPACYVVELDEAATDICGPLLTSAWQRVQLDRMHANRLDISFGLKRIWRIYLPLVAKK
jgi:hypothetical protein